MTLDYSIHHTHEGSIGNLCLPEIKAKMESILYSFDFEGVEGKIKTTSPLKFLEVILFMDFKTQVSTYIHY